jgi:hypothetical protein
MIFIITMLRIIDNYMDDFIRHPTESINAIARIKSPILNAMSTALVKYYDYNNILKTIMNIVIIVYYF